MNSKIVGFTISPVPIDHSGIDIFNKGLKLVQRKYGNYHIFFWGIGDIEKCLLPTGQWTLSFPHHNSLEDRNVLITLDKQKITIENDWLGSIPIYYHLKKRIVSTNINFILKQLNRIEFHPEGVSNYLEFGFSILEQTPISEIKFLRYYSKLTINSEGIGLNYKKDIVLNSLNNKTDVQNVLNKIHDYIQENEKKVFGDIIIPTSGGYDSRLLNAMIDDKKKIFSFTYGISKNQEKSFEVVKAKEISKILKTKWRIIHLGDFNKFFTEWYQIYGPAVHLHGMYHIEFYKHISEEIKSSATFLSGIMGDAWSGKFDIPLIKKAEDLIKLGFVHEISFPYKFCLLSNNGELKSNFLENTKDHLLNSKYRIIAAMRFKIILLSYLMTLPDYFGFPSWTPMLKLDHVISMLNLPEAERANRKWQVDFFKKNGLAIEEQKLTYDKNNDLNAVGLKKYAIPEININALKSIINNKSLVKLNKEYIKLVRNPLAKPLRSILLDKRYIGEILRILKVKKKNNIKPYNQLLILKSLELLARNN
jgi:hypothetical protein